MWTDFRKCLAWRPFDGMRANLQILLALPLLAVIAGPLMCAGNFSFSGSFTTDDQFQLFKFDLSSTANVICPTYLSGAELRRAA